MSWRNGTGLSPEDKCLLLLARRRLTPTGEDTARSLLGQSLAWPLILRRAQAHGVVPLLTRNLERLGFPGVPADVRTRLEALDRLNAARNMLFRRGLIDVLKRFGEAGVPVIPLKGVTLADSLYGDITLRVCSDLDILVPRHAVGQTVELLATAGYEPAEEDREADGMDLEIVLGSNIEYAFVRRDHALPHRLELHWDIVWRWRPDTKATDDLWANARPKAFWGVEAYALSPEWELLYLAVHAAHHRWQTLKWLVDIHDLCACGGIDWPKVTDTATRLGWEKVLQLTLAACHALLDTPVPAEFARIALPRWVRLFPTFPAPPGIQDALFATRLFPRPSEKLRYLVRLLLVPTLRERRLLRLPPSLGLLYYSLRPVRLGVKWGWRGVRQSSTTQKT